MVSEELGYRGVLTAEQIKLLITVSNRRSFNQAATALGVRQPAVTQQVKRLEGRFGCRLFDRGPGGIKLTQDGEAVLIYARAMLALGSDLLSNLSKSNESPTLRVGLNEDFGRSALPAILGLLIRDFPLLRLKVMTGDGEFLFEALDGGLVDVVVTRSHAHRPHSELLWSTETVWLGKRDLSPPVDGALPLILPNEGNLRGHILAALSGASRAWHVVFESMSLEMMEVALRAGLGVSAFAAGFDMPGIGRLDVQQLQLPPLPRSNFTLETSARESSAAVEVFRRTMHVAVEFGFGMEDAPP